MTDGPVPSFHPAFPGALLASRAFEPFSSSIETFGRLVGTWSLSNRFRPDAHADWIETPRRTWIFAYILDGRGVQDVLLGSDRAEGPADLVVGTTVRVYDDTIGAWRVNFFGPLTGEYVAMVASRHRDGIRQDGTQTDGRAVRWNFTSIAGDSFDWDAYVSDDGGGSWWHQQSMSALRVS